MDGTAILDALRLEGWVAVAGNLPQLRMALHSAGATPATSQRGRSHGVLRPYSVSEAPVHSMSAIYGLDEQPMHTDGAHLGVPPDVIALWSADPSPTPTLIWAPLQSSKGYPDYLRTGLFSVRSKGGTFLAPALKDDQLRFDPVCMSPGDGLARKASEYFESLRSEAVRHEWTESNALLLIDNRRCLHARGAVAENDDQRRLERVTFRLEPR